MWEPMFPNYPFIYVDLEVTLVTLKSTRGISAASSTSARSGPLSAAS